MAKRVEVVLFFVAVAALAFAFAATEVEARTWYTCYLDGSGKATVKEGRNEREGVATGFFDDTIDTRGYGELDIRSSSSHSDDNQMYCAGYLEGYLSALRIRQFYLNFWYSTFNSTNYWNVWNFAQQTMSWTQAQVKANTSSDYWVNIGLVMTQVQGLTDGYNAQSPSDEQFNVTQMVFLNMLGDLDDLIPAMRRKAAKDQNLPVEDMMTDINDIAKTYLNTHCSALIKPTIDDIFAGQDMWSDYWQLLPVYKTYTFPLKNRAVLSRRVSFASYPGLLSSEDDFYATDTELVVMETTNAVFNLSLYDSLTPQSLSCWLRTIVSNRIARSGEDWVKVMAMYNSGTYNNQWMILDLKLWRSGHTQQAPNTLWIGSQIPGQFETADVTHVMNSQGYWASYNVPYFQDLFVKLGYAEMEQKYGSLFSYSACPRARIFRQRQDHVKDLKDMQSLMRYNDWKEDPLSLDCPINQISARADLVPVNNTNQFCQPAAFGAINAKITSARLWGRKSEHGEAVVVGGPTHDNLKPFQWTRDIENQFPLARHWGQPRTWPFDWMHVRNN